MGFLRQIAGADQIAILCGRARLGYVAAHLFNHRQFIAIQCAIDPF